MQYLAVKEGAHIKPLTIILIRNVGGLDQRITLERVGSIKILDNFKNSANSIFLMNGCAKREKEVS